MEPNQLNLSTYHNWFGNVDFDLMCKTYLEDGEDSEDDTLQVENQEGTVHDSASNWWEEECEVWSQNFDHHTHQHLGGDVDASQLTEYTTSAEIPLHAGNGFQPSHLSDLERYQTIGDTGDTYGHYGATLGASTLDAPYTTNESLDGTWAPHYSLDPNTSAVQDCFEDPALESVLRHLGERGGGIGESPYDVPGGLLFLEEPALPATNDQLESAGPTATVDSQQISASDVLVKMNASRKHRVRGPKNWEFLMRLLVHPTANPAIIGWEDEEKGIFRLRNPKVIAQLWASRNENSNDLSYNNFARGLRHHYKKGILIPIPERQLVYKCGQKALDYLNQIRCSQVPA